MASDQIQDIKERLDIVNVISTYVPLENKGKHYKGLCPFHEEKTPSFVVSPEMQIYKCFGCGKGGDIYSFLQEIEGMSFAEALQVLSEQAGVKLERRQKSEKEKKEERVLTLLEKTTELYSYLLAHHPTATGAKEYLVRRGVSEKAISDFRLGYAPNNWHFLENFLRKKGYPTDELVSSGMVVAKDTGGYYDRFRGRLMFPLVDHQGKVLGFSARALAPQQEPKYINSPESPLFNKSAFLYGLHSARSAIRRDGHAVVVEGVMDVISPYQIGIENVVAPLGTALTSPQVNLLSRLTDTLTFCFDSDNAGQEATKRGITLAQKHNFNVKVALLSKGKDPDELARQSPEALKESLAHSLAVMDYYFHQVISSTDVSSASGKKRTSQELLPLIKSLRDSIERDHYLHRLSDVLSVDMNVLQKALEEHASVDLVAEKVSEVLQKSPGQVPLEDYILSLILHAPMEKAQKTLRKLGRNDFSGDAHARLFIALKENLLERSYKLNIQKFALKLEEELQDLVRACYLRDLDGLEADSDLLSRELDQSLQLLKNRSIKRELKHLSTRIRAAEEVGDDIESERMQKQFQELTNRL